MHFPILAQITNTDQLRDSLAQAATAAANTPVQDQLTVWDLISLGSWLMAACFTAAPTYDLSIYRY